MADTVQMNFNVQAITKARVKEMAAATFRNPGDFMDWLVDEEWKRRAESARISESWRQFNAGQGPAPVATLE